MSLNPSYSRGVKAQSNYKLLFLVLTGQVEPLDQLLSVLGLLSVVVSILCQPRTLMLATC